MHEYLSLLSRYTHIGFWTTFIFKEFLIFQKWTNKCCTSSSLNWYETCTENIYFVFFSDYKTRILDELTIFFFGRQNLFQYGFLNKWFPLKDLILHHSIFKPLTCFVSLINVCLYIIIMYVDLSFSYDFNSLFLNRLSTNTYILF